MTRTRHPVLPAPRRPLGTGGTLLGALACAALAGCASGQAAQVMASLPAPRPATAAAGRIVAGFPAVVPVPADAHVTASAVQPHDELLAVSVTGTSRTSTSALLAFFRARLTKAGFTTTDDKLLPPGASGAAFERSGGAELVIVAVVDRGVERSFSVGGTVSP